MMDSALIDFITLLKFFIFLFFSEFIYQNQKSKKQLQVITSPMPLKLNVETILFTYFSFSTTKIWINF